ncbi:MAG: TonB-dependent receptor plug domain-containing protein [Gemmatimonadota bacterium]|nr:TonB-dependent receptor plug domain-containing protein [Gemmatimonadota bacterium]
MSPTLAPVVVTGEQRDHSLDHVGFYQRSQHNVGHYLTAEQIKRMSDFRFTDLLRGIPGLRVGIDKHGEDVVTSGRAGGSMLNETHGCVQYFVDGLPWGNGALEAIGTVGDKDYNKRLAQMAIEQGRQLNAVLKKSEILGIEVYQGGGAPAYFNQGGHNCATIVVWTTMSVFN